MKYVIFSLILIVAAPVFADCLYDGSNYPEGTIIGPYICQGSEWIFQ